MRTFQSVWNRGDLFQPQLPIGRTLPIVSKRDSHHY